MKRKLKKNLLSALLPLLPLLPISAQSPDSLSAPVVPYQTGRATYYSARMQGRRTASGRRYDKDAFTCAHRSLPFGTRIRVVNTRNGKSAVVEVIDRGPFRRSLVTDLSTAAASALDMLRAGVVPVELYLMPDSVATDTPLEEKTK